MARGQLPAEYRLPDGVRHRVGYSLASNGSDLERCFFHGCSSYGRTDFALDNHGLISYLRPRAVVTMLKSSANPLLRCSLCLATSTLAWAGSQAGRPVRSADAAAVVKITPLGSHASEFCRNDRALLFDDPTGVRVLWDPGRTIAGATDLRLGDVHVVILPERMRRFMDQTNGSGIAIVLPLSGVTREFDGSGQCLNCP